MKNKESRDIECKYNSVGGYIEELFKRRCTDQTDIDEMVGAYLECQDELSTCSKRDWNIIKMAQVCLCEAIVHLYIENKKAG